jgi:hypothetical protein
VFSFKNTLVEIVTLDPLGDSDSNGSTIGTTTQWYLQNTDLTREMRALKYAELYKPLVRTYMEDPIQTTVTDIRASMGVAQSMLEYCMVG